MRVLLIGANGMLGKDIVQEWKDDELIPATSRDADIRDFEQVERLITATRPEWVVLTAAYTDVDGSERDPEGAFAVNGKGTGIRVALLRVHRHRTLTGCLRFSRTRCTSNQ